MVHIAAIARLKRLAAPGPAWGGAVALPVDVAPGIWWPCVAAGRNFRII